MSSVLVIRNWDEHFECSQSRKVGRSLNWVATPCKHDGKSFRRLMLRPDGVEIYGAWILLVQIAAKCPRRGVLADQDGPLVADDFAIKTGCPVSTFEKAIKVLSGTDIGWVVVEQWERAGSVLPPPTNQPTVPTIPTDQPPNPPTQASPATNADPQAGGLAGDFVVPSWEAVAQRLASIGVVRWSQAINDAKACGCSPKHAHALISFAELNGFGPGAIAKRFAIASPTLGINSGWPNTGRPETREEERVKKQSAKRAQHAAEQAEQDAWRIIKAGRSQGVPDDELKAQCESKGLPWPNPAAVVVSQKTKVR